jgi:putative ABC transport system permease protein
VLKALPEAGFEMRSRDNADPRFAKGIERFTQFLTLVGLTQARVIGTGHLQAVGEAVEAAGLDQAGGAQRAERDEQART